MVFKARKMSHMLSYADFLRADLETWEIWKWGVGDLWALWTCGSVEVCDVWMCRRGLGSRGVVQLWAGGIVGLWSSGVKELRSCRVWESWA